MRRDLVVACFGLIGCAASGAAIQTNGAAEPPPSAGPHVTVTFPARVEAKFGTPVDVEIHLRNDGGAVATVPAPHGQWLTPEIADSAGRPVTCRRRPQNFMPAVKKLEPGQSLSGVVDLSMWCTFPGPGEYRANIHYETRGDTMTPVTGSASLAIVLSGS
jgi:hypothetical protein